MGDSGLQVDVAALVPADSAYGRAIVRGIAAYGRTLGRWSYRVTMNPGDYVGHRLPPPQLGFIVQLRAESAKALAVFRRPIVSVSSVDEASNLPRVLADDQATGRLAAQHLYSLGLRQFAYLGTLGHGYSRWRHDGFVAELARLQPQGVPILAHQTPLDKPTSDLEGLVTWLAGLPRPIGLFCCNDVHADLARRVCQDLGMSVPKDVAVLGVDNDELLRDNGSPSLSSIELGADRIGYEAAALLTRLSQGGEPPDLPLLIPPLGVIPRGSTEMLATDDALVAEGLRVIRTQFRNGMAVKQLAGALAVSRSTLDERFRAALGHSPAEELRRMRLEAAQQLLIETDEPMPAVALACGFSNAKEFSKTFIREIGQPPTRFRQQYRLRVRGDGASTGIPSR